MREPKMRGPKEPREPKMREPKGGKMPRESKFVMPSSAKKLSGFGKGPKL